MKKKNRIEMDESTKRALMTNEIVPTELDVRGRQVFPKEYRAAGFKGVVWKGLDEYSGDVAIKLTVFDDYLDRSYLKEAGLARQLRGRRPFADFHDVGLIEIAMPSGEKKKFVCFVEEWIEGWTLSDYLATQDISSSDPGCQ